MQRRVVITGMGAVSALGLGAEALWRGMVEARSGIADLVQPDAEFELRMKVVAAVPGFEPSAHFASSKLTLLDRVSQFALVAAREAVAQAGLDFTSEGRGARTAVVVGTGIGGELTRDEQSRRLYRERAERTHLSLVFIAIVSAEGCDVGKRGGVNLAHPVLRTPRLAEVGK